MGGVPVALRVGGAGTVSLVIKFFSQIDDHNVSLNPDYKVRIPPHSLWLKIASIWVTVRLADGEFAYGYLVLLY